MVSTEGRVKDEIRLNADQTKSRHPRIVFLSPKLPKALEGYVSTDKRREAHWAFFATQKEPQCGFTANTMAHYFWQLYKGAGIDGASSFSGRRSFATSLSSKGASVRVLMHAMGHRNISTTIGYIVASDDMLRRAVALV